MIENQVDKYGTFDIESMFHVQELWSCIGPYWASLSRGPMTRQIYSFISQNGASLQLLKSKLNILIPSHTLLLLPFVYICLPVFTIVYPFFTIVYHFFPFFW